jgi:hypothetical protein
MTYISYINELFSAWFGPSLVLRVVVVIVLASACLAIAVVFILLAEFYARLTKLFFVLAALFFLIYFALSMLLIYFVATAIATVNFASKEQQNYILVAVSVAYWLFVLRNKQRAIYGFFEVAVGVAAVWSSTLTISSPNLSNAIAVLGGVYIIIRGLDNIDQGLEAFCRKIPRPLGQILWGYWFLFMKWQRGPALKP